jgi:Cu(I)/Ag(I) efflux system membrane fusion protein
MTMSNDSERSPRPAGASPARTIGLMALALAVGAGGTWLALRPRAGDHHDHGPAAAAAQTYQCPMHPQVIMDHQGDCPICGMKLVPMEAGAPGPGAPGPAPAPSQAQAQGQAKQMYQCPMHPQVIMDHPGDCPICGMKLVPMEAGPGQGGEPAVAGLAPVRIDPERQQLIGLTTAPVAEGPVGGDLRTTARLAVDETRVRHIHVKVDGYVEKLFVDFVGMPVAKGAPLFSFYSPDFVAAQQEFLLALRTEKSLAGGALQGSGADLLEAARRRMSLWDVPEAELQELERTGQVRKSLTLRSPITGVVTAKTAVEGIRLTPADTPFEVTDLGHVWGIADVYEQEIPRVKVGMAADLALGSFPGRTFRGRVAFIEPQIDPRSRTAKVRVDLPNPRGELKPEMFGEMVLRSQARKGLVVPVDAVLDSGVRKVVFVALGDGRFSPREVQTGANLGETVEVRSGLRAGETVVTRANFLVDSESRLKAALSQFTGGTDPARQSAPAAAGKSAPAAAGKSAPAAAGKSAPAAAGKPAPAAAGKPAPAAAGKPAPAAAGKQ